MRTGIGAALGLAMVLASGSAWALETVKVADGVYAFVGEKQQRSAQNLANNATFGLVVTADGAVLVDPGGSYKGAAALHDAVRAVTDKPVRFVIDTGGQDHRWLGNAYWKAQGAKIIAANAAVADQKERASLELTMLSQLIGTALDGTTPAYADITFDERYAIDLGGTRIDIVHPGPAHTPGDAFVWLPEQKVVFAGDIVFTERMLGILDFSKSKGWVEAFEAIQALAPEQVVPGHGAPTTLARAKADTYDYLVALRTRIRKHMEAGGDILSAPKVDQSDFARLEQFDALAGRNAQAVFAEMEFE